MPAIRCENLCRSYGQVEALKSLDLVVEAGSVFGFLGRNGAGKTTTIRLLTGLAQPTSGRAWVDNILITDGNETARNRFGYLPEVPAFYNWMTPREFLAYIGQLFGMKSSTYKKRIDELLELTDLLGPSKRKIGGFSRGMRQRLGVAQALLNSPPVLFLDEPTSALDPAGRKSVLDLIDRLRGTSTIFLSSHILADIERVCDTIAVIHEGELLMVAGRDELMSRYQSNVVQLEFESAEAAENEPFLSLVRALPWVINIEREGVTVNITVEDPAEARRQLLKMLAENELAVIRYEWVRPSLEEVFLSISDGTK